MILLAISGSTKTEWCIVDKTGIHEHAYTDGINPYFQPRKEISHTIRLQLPEVFFKKKTRTIYFYGVGCTDDEKKNVVKSSIQTQFRTPAVVNNILLGSARSLFSNEPGIACILGTESNSCLFDGVDIVKNVNPLGYILGDEGSGSTLGKTFLADCLKDLAPQELSQPFYQKYGIDPEQILDYIYKKPFCNKLLSCFSSYLADHIDHPYVHELVYNGFEDFFVRNIQQYEYDKYPIRIAGTTANRFSKVLNQVATDLQIKIEDIKESIMDGLIKHHFTQQVSA